MWVLLTLTSFSLSPLHLLTMLLALMLKKVVLQEVATALASRVLLHGTAHTHTQSRMPGHLQHGTA